MDLLPSHMYSETGYHQDQHAPSSLAHLDTGRTYLCLDDHVGPSSYSHGRRHPVRLQLRLDVGDTAQHLYSNK